MAEGGDVILHTDAGTNRVGINTTSPTSELEVDGEVTATTILLETAVKYTDAGGDNRYALMFPGSDIVAVTNRASDGVVQIRANTSTPGSAGETTVAQFEDDKMVCYAANIDFTNLPTSDPSVAGRLWNDSNTVKISAG